MSTHRKTNILFTGYAPVHFACFRPLFEQLCAMPDFDVHVSGGLRTKTDDGYVYDPDGMYGSFDVPHNRIIPEPEIREQSFDAIFAANTKMILPKKVDTRVQIFHGISFRNRGIREENMNCDHYFLAGPYMKRKFIERGLMVDNDPRALPIGFMKTDRLVNGTLDRHECLRRYGFDGSRPVILYAPTGEKDNSLETMGENVLSRLRDTDQYDILVKLHDHPKRSKPNWFEQLAPLEGDHFKIAREFDIIPLLFVADLLISDASSVSSEYSLMDRPMIFLDVPKLLQRTRARKSSTVDVDTWGQRAGALVKKAEDIEDAVANELAHPERHAAIRQEMSRDLFFNPGHAVDAAIAWLCERFGAGPAAVSHPASNPGQCVARAEAKTSHD